MVAKRKSTCLVLSAFLVFQLLCGANARAVDPLNDSAFDYDLTELSLEELMTIEITSVGKKTQKLSEAAAAVFVITQEDIRRSGATSIPELLRMVPGVQVARINANKWAISARGFNGQFANKLLVLMDGRTLYDPVFSGVFWDVQDYLLEDIDRIEIIRGPGAALWGANAVNGVINIITKNAWDSTGGNFSIAAGSEEKFLSQARYGDTVGKKGAWRIYAKYFDRDDSENVDGSSAADDWNVARAGFRTDWNLTDFDQLTVQGDVYDGKKGHKSALPSMASPSLEKIETGDDDISGGNLLARWDHRFSCDSNTTLQIYYDRTEREEVVGAQDRDIMDVDFMHRFFLGESQEILWGLGYRYTSDSISSDFPVMFDPDSRSDDLFSAFIQDEISLAPERLMLTLGSKFEHNDYTGFEIQPSARLMFTPNENHSLWASVSRAVRTPSRYEDDVIATVRYENIALPGLPAPVPAAINVIGDRDVDSEDLYAFELGYRFKPAEKLTLDIAAFYNQYDSLVGAVVKDLDTTKTPFEVNREFDNPLDGNTQGLELAVDWQAMRNWQLKLAYTFFLIDIDADSDMRETSFMEDNDPRHQASLRSILDLTENLELDCWARYVDHIDNGDVDAYFDLDIRIGYKPSKHLEFAVVAQNLLDSRRPEFVETMFFIVPTEVKREVYGKLTWSF